jgi:alkyl hydroperoxide reductase subunit D
MSALETVRDSLPEEARDIKLNLQAVLDGSGGVLSPAQRWGVAVATAIASRNPTLRDAVLEEARAVVDAAVISDARAAAALMAMNNVFYRFRHTVDRAEYAEKPARLRMMRLAKPASNKADFELFALAVSSINNCSTCVRAHEQAVRDGGLTEDHVHEAVRIAASVFATAVSLEMGAA